MCLHICKVTRCMCCSVCLTSQDRMPGSRLVKEHVLEDLRVRREEKGYIAHHQHHHHHTSPPHQHAPVDVSRVTILPVSMTTTCCCPPLICLSLPPFLNSLPPFLPLSFLPSLHTLLVFQGQRGSQPDSAIETEIGVESGQRRAIAMGEATDKGRLEDRNPPDIVIVSTLDLRQ